MSENIPPARPTTRFPRLIAAIATATVLACVAGAATAMHDHSFDSTGDTSPHLKRTIRIAEEKAIGAGAVAIGQRIDNGEHVEAATLGVSDRATGVSASADDEFQIGSNTKTFVAVVALQLVAEGLLSLDDTVGEHLPDVVPDGDGITIRMLLQQTTGLFDYLSDEQVGTALISGRDRAWTSDELLAISFSHDPAFDPGAGWSYSNTNFVIAGMINEKVTGLSMAQLVERRIAQPLNLERTYWPGNETFHGGHFHGYFRNEPDGDEYIEVTDNSLSWGDAAGAMISTLRDMSIFEQALQSGRLLAAPQLEAMRITIAIPGQETNAGYGLGLARLDTPCGTVWGHTGGTLGYLTQAWASEDGERTFVQVVTTGESTPAGPDTAIASAASAAAQEGICAMFGKDVPAATSAP